MISTALRPVLVLVVLSTLSAASASGYDDAEAEKMAEEIKNYRFETVTTKEGLKFSIPSDMPIERKNGLVVPIPFEEYLYFKFKKIEERMTALEKQIDEMEKKILSRFDELKAHVTSRTPEPVPSEPTAS